MKDLKITEVQVDCKELSQEQIDKVISVFVKNKIPKCSTITSGMGKEYTYLRVYHNNCVQITFLRQDEDFTTLTYDQFIELFDKPKKKLKNRLKKLEDRIVSLELKLSEKEDKNSTSEVINNLPIVIEKGMRFKSESDGTINEIESIKGNNVFIRILREANATRFDKSIVEILFKKGNWVQLPPTEKKESEPKKGDICKFWNDDENSYEIGRYEYVSRISSNVITHNHINILTLDSFENAKVISIDEALELFKKQLLNEK